MLNIPTGKITTKSITKTIKITTKTPKNPEHDIQEQLQKTNKNKKKNKQIQQQYIQTYFDAFRKETKQLDQLFTGNTENKHETQEQCEQKKENSPRDEAQRIQEKILLRILAEGGEQEN